MSSTVDEGVAGVCCAQGWVMRLWVGLDPSRHDRDRIQFRIIEIRNVEGLEESVHLD